MGRFTRRYGAPVAAMGAAFSPLAAFSGGKKGLWWDPSDIATGFTDSAGTTPQTATGDPTGKRSDKTGNGLHFLQATAAARSIYTVAGAIQSDVLDGVDDNGGTGAFAAGTLSNSMDFFCAIKRSSAAGGVLMANGVAGAPFFGSYNPSAGVTTSGVGAGFSNFVDGVSIPGDDRVLLNTALTVGSWVVFEVRNLDLSTMTAIGASFYGSGLFVAGSIGGIILCESQPALRNSLRTWLGAKVGRTL